ncbi:MAG TPA: ATP-binding protein [Polyangiaceae bacterium]
MEPSIRVTVAALEASTSPALDHPELRGHSWYECNGSDQAYAVKSAVEIKATAAEQERFRTRVVTITVPGEFAFRGIVLRTVATVCKLACSTSPEAARFSDEVMSAVGEAFNNAVIHAYGTMSGNVTLSISYDSSRVVIELFDDGAAFELETVPDYAGNDPQESGMGLFIIRNFVDQLTYQAGPPNCLRMIKALPFA